MPSIVVRSFSYEPSDRRLDVVFTSGRRYSYHEVAPEVFAAMTLAFAKGAFFNRHIRGKYRYSQPGPPTSGHPLAGSSQ
jgi:hypothetical protein